MTPGAYADDMQVAGTVLQCIETYGSLLRDGPACGIFLNERKTQLVVHAADEEAAKAQVAASTFKSIKVVTFARSLGSTVGSQADKDN